MEASGLGDLLERWKDAILGTGSIRIDPELLPHWARVAFAVRCAMRVVPLYTRYWPDAPQECVAALRVALTQLGESTAAGAPHPGLDDSFTAALIAAGAPLARGLEVPSIMHEMEVASIAASAVRVAIQTGMASPAHSVGHASNACCFARDAAELHRDIATEARFGKDFLLLRNLAYSGQWTDATPVNLTLLPTI